MRSLEYYRYRNTVRKIKSKVRRYKQKSCGSKTVFRNEYAAENFVRLENDPTLNHYRCVFCLKWHVGHKKYATFRRQGNLSTEYRKYLILQIVWILQELAQQNLITRDGEGDEPPFRETLGGGAFYDTGNQRSA